MPLTDVVALAAGSKSPPGVDHDCVLKNRNVQVVSPVVAWMPSPSPEPVPPRAALDVPSPQDARARWTATGWAPLFVFDMCSVSEAALMVAPAGSADRSNSRTARRMRLVADDW